jgi:hypothetical protein
VRDDLSFEIFAYPGTLTIRPMALAGLAIRSVRLNGRDVTRAFELEAGVPVTDLEVEVTATTARLTIATVNGREEPVGEREVIVFPQDETRWGFQMPGHGSSGLTDQQGRYQSPPLLAGAYYVAVIDTPEPGQNNDPEFLEALRPRAQRVDVREGETAEVKVRVR